MLKFANLILKNLGRNKVRTGLTTVAVMALVAIYSMVSIVTDTISDLAAAHSSQTRLIVRERWTAPSRFPTRYLSKIASIPEVDDWTVWNFYGGDLGSTGGRAAGLATMIDNLSEMHPGMGKIDPELQEAMRREKTGVLMGKYVIKKLGLEVGQKFTLNSFTHQGKNLEFKVVGVLPSEIWGHTFFFRKDYYEQGVGDQDMVNVVWIRVRNADAGRRVAQQIEAMFENSPVELRVESESAGVARMSGRIDTVVNIINFVGTVLLIDMIIILSNSISMTVRERRKEMAILKVLGFQPNFIAGLVISEAMLVGAIAGWLGAGTAYAVYTLNSAGLLPWKISMLLQFPVTLEYVFRGALVGALVGFGGSVIPAWNARKVHAAEVFAQGG